MNEESSSSESESEVSPAKVSRAIPMCRNCGHIGHHTCKRIFSDVERNEINTKVAKHLEDKRRQINVSRKKHKRERYPSIATSSPKSKRAPFQLCEKCAEEGHLSKNCTASIPPEQKKYIAELFLQRKADNMNKRKLERRSPEILEADRLRHARIRQTPEWKEQQLERQSNPEWVMQTRNTRQLLSDNNIRVAEDVVAADIERPIGLVCAEEIARIDNELDFNKYKRPDKEIYRDACPHLSYDCLIHNCCIVCGCDVPKSSTRFCSIDDNLVHKFRRRLSLSESRKQRMPLQVQEDYNLRNYDARLDGIILCKYGLYTPEHEPINLDSFEEVHNLQLCICDGCFSVIDKTSVDELEALKPPMDAIANGNWIGYLPSEYLSISRTEEQTIALMILNIYLSTVITSDNKVINSHHFVIKNPNPILREFANDVTGTVRFTLVGAHVSEAMAMIRQRFPLRVDLARGFLEWLDQHNVLYQAHNHHLHHDLDDVLQHHNFVVDRSDDSTHRVSPSLIRLLQFGISSYNHGTADEAYQSASTASSRDEHLTSTSNSSESEFATTTGTTMHGHREDDSDYTSFEENARTHMIFQPVLASASTHTVHAPRQQPITDVIAFNSSTLPKKRGLASLVYAYPTIFPYGCGGYDEPRDVRMTDVQWTLRVLRMHGIQGSRNSQHYGLLPAAFDMIATAKAYQSQFVSMRVNEAAITNFGLWNKDDIIECLRYSEQVEARSRRGLLPHAAPANIRGLLGMVNMVKPGMSAMYGSDASRSSARQVAFGFTIRMSNPHVMVTHSPDPYGNYILSINTSNMRDPTHVDYTINLNDILPSRRSRKKHANSDPFQCAIYAKAINDAFIEHFLGWSIKFKGPKKEGGVFGLIRWFHESAETQTDGTLHFHLIASVYGLPRTSEQMTAALNDPLFAQRFAEYIDAITPPTPYLADACTHLNACPVEGCVGTLEALPFPGEAFCQRKADQLPAITAYCGDCNAQFKHKDVLLQRIHAFAKEHEIDTNPLLVDEYRCKPPLLSAHGELSNTDLVYLALSLLEFQFHHETHTKSCFKITSRTPQGLVCRYLFPRISKLEQTCIQISTGKVISHRPIGCEYYNLCSLLWTSLSKNNMDIQFLINGGSRRSTSYSTKYTFKAQRPASALTMKLGLISQAYARTFCAADDGNITANERGRRAINKALYQFTKPQELHTTMAAYMLLNDGPFVRSHQPEYLNLKQLCACYLDTNETNGRHSSDPNDSYNDEDENDGDDGDDDDGDDDDDSEIEGTFINNRRSSNRDNSNDSENEEASGYVEIQIQNSTLLRHLNKNTNSNENDSSEIDEESNEADDFLDGVCLLTDYWYRPESMSNLNYVEVREGYHIVRKQPPLNSKLAMHPSHPKSGGLYWLRNMHQEQTCIVFVGGKGSQLPNLLKQNITKEEKEFYYKAMLILFKPHNHTVKCIREPHDTYQHAYEEFLQTNSAHAKKARLQEELLANYYLDDATIAVDADETEEAAIFSNHPFTEVENDPRNTENRIRNNNDNAANGDEEGELLAQMIEDNYDEADIDFAFNIMPSDTTLPIEIERVFDITSRLHPTVSVPRHEGDLPVFHNYDQYKAELINPRSVRAEHFNGAALFRQWNAQPHVKLKAMSEFFEPIPWTDTSHLGDTSDAILQSLGQFAAIKDISIAMRLNFWQHAVFETYARHLLYRYVTDIQEEDQSAARVDLQCPTDLKPQLIGFVGGIAGSGKSAVIAALLMFAKLWGRRDSIETMAFTGLASLQVDGETIHASRGLGTFDFSHSNSEVITKNVRRVYLTIIDEVSMLGQKLCGSAEALTRHILRSNLPWGGIHVLLGGDFFQLPPIKSPSITKPPSDKTQDTNYSWYLAGFELFKKCNYHVFLTENMRQRHDELYQQILERMHWGVNNEDDIAILNRRSIDHPDLDIDEHYSQYRTDVVDYFSPMAIATNRERCIFNKETMYAFAKKERTCIYEILAHSSRRGNRATIQRLKYTDDDFTSKIPLLFSFHTHAMPVMITKRIPELEAIKCISNGTLGFIIGFIHHGSSTPCMSPDYVDNDDLFNVTLTDNNVTVKRFKQNPAYILFKVRGCKRQLVNGYPIGVVAIPLATYQTKFTLPNAKAQMTMAITTFPIIPAYAMTPEKLQGVTLENELFISALSNRSPQILYVVFSRVRSLNKILLTQRLSLEYVRKFVPPEDIVKIMKELLDRINIPCYIPESELQKLDDWLCMQHSYALQALALHRARTRNKKSRQA